MHSPSENSPGVAAPAPSTLSVVIPLYQEADNVDRLLEAVHQGLENCANAWELVCVDDGSTDDTAARLRGAVEHRGNHVRVIQLRRNYGQTAAMQTGIDATRGEIIVTMDGDLQNDPADIPRMVRELGERDLDLLQGWRRERHDKPLRKLFSRVANWLIARVTGVNLHDYGCSLKVYRGEVIRHVRLFGEMHRFIPVWVAQVTSPARIGETVVNHKPRLHGESKYGLSRTFRVITDLLSAFFFLRFRARPGHFFGTIGLVFGALGGAILAYLLVLKLGFGADIGNRPLLLVGVILTVFAVQFFTTGVLAELLSRVFLESSPRPNYAIAHQTPADQVVWKQAAADDQTRADTTPDRGAP
ncbi:MAG: glycosyltransferase family 2 protein [Pseudomonadota bacterium]